MNYLRSVDKMMKALINVVGDIKRQYIPDPFVALVHSIVFQQQSYKAANTIWNRFEEIVDSITPETILETDFEVIRKSGLSKTKISYIRNISQAVFLGELDLTDIHKMSDNDIINSLIRMKGIGEWTAEMFLIFSLNRKDVISYKDLGIRKGLQWLYKLNHEPTKEEFNHFRDRYSPYNTLASFYLWEITIRNLFRYTDIESVSRENIY